MATSQLRSALSKVFLYLNAMADYDAEVAKAILEVNAVIEPFAITIKSRATIRAKKKEELNATPSPEGATAMDAVDSPEGA